MDSTARAPDGATVTGRIAAGDQEMPGATEVARTNLPAGAVPQRLADAGHVLEEGDRVLLLGVAGPGEGEHHRSCRKKR